MSRIARFVTPWWLGGVALAAGGIMIVRVAAPTLDPPTRPLAQIAGELLALAGLLVIAWGISRRVRGGPPG